MIGNLALRWIATALFGVSIATYMYSLLAQHDRWQRAVNHLLHLTMSTAMILMAWRVGVNLPTVAPMVFFVLATVWFAGMAGRVSCATRDRLTNGYNALIMAAMVWMYVLMSGTIPGSTGHSPDHALSGSLGTKMPGMEMSSPETPVTLPGPEWITGVNWIATLGCALMALYWACRYLAMRRTKAVPRAAQLAPWELLGQLFTAAGTGLMFAMML